MTHPLGIAVAGAAGRMGQALVRAIAAASDLRLAGATERPGSALLGQDCGRLAGLDPLGVVVIDQVADAARDAGIWIDFTTPKAVLAALTTLPSSVVAVIGATGFTPTEENTLLEAAQSRAIVKSGNFSLGVNVLLGLVKQATTLLGPDWDVEIVEAHHRAKVDAPSGTALMLGEAAAAGRGKTLSEVRLAAREGLTGARPEGGIGFAAVRGGGIVGEHSVLIATGEEAIRLEHVAYDRALFAKGALHAARWAVGRRPGLYSMQDVLGL